MVEGGASNPVPYVAKKGTCYHAKRIELIGGLK
jgi:hypothetical protein